MKIATTLTLMGLALLLSACASVGGKNDLALSSRTLPAAASTVGATPATPAKRAESTAMNEKTTAQGLRLARLLRDQWRFQAATEVYAQLDSRGALSPLEVLEYASTAANVQDAQQSLALFGRARRLLVKEGAPRSAAAEIALCSGMGRARLALGQLDAALNDFDCVLQREPDHMAALNGKAIVLDTQGQHAQARRLLERAAELDPSDARIVNNLALSWLADGQAGQAIRLLDQADNPRVPSLKLNLALAYALEGQTDKARTTLATVMSATLAERAMADFDVRRQRIAQGTPLAQELVAASRQWVALQEGTAP